MLRHRQRDRQANRLVASLDDYRTVYGLVGPMYEATVTGATEQVRQVVQTVGEIRTAGQKATYSALAARTGLHVEQVKRLASMAIRHGWLTNDETRKNHPADLAVGEPLPKRAGLPTSEELGDFTDVHAISHGFTVSQPDRGYCSDVAGRSATEGGDGAPPRTDDREEEAEAEWTA